MLSAISLGLDLAEYTEQHDRVPGEWLYRKLVAEAAYARQIGDSQ